MTRAATRTGAGVLERDHELAVLSDVLRAAASERGGLVWVEGPAGIGKTRLLDAARERAAALGMTVLAARAARLERDFAFGVVRGLFEPLVARRPGLLAGAARLAAPVVSPGPRPAGTRDGDTDAGSALHGLYWLTANLADAGPVLLVVDDAHVADAASLRAIAYLARRVSELGVAIVLGAQPPAVHTASPLVDALREAETTTVLRPAPLSRDGIEALVRCRFPGSPDPSFTAACHEVTGGNPLLVHALLAAVAEAGGRRRPGGRRDGRRARARRGGDVRGAPAARGRHRGRDGGAGRRPARRTRRAAPRRRRQRARPGRRRPGGADAGRGAAAAPGPPADVRALPVRAGRRRRHRPRRAPPRPPPGGGRPGRRRRRGRARGRAPAAHRGARRSRRGRPAAGRRGVPPSRRASPRPP